MTVTSAIESKAVSLPDIGGKVLAGAATPDSSASSFRLGWQALLQALTGQAGQNGGGQPMTSETDIAKGETFSDPGHGAPGQGTQGQGTQVAAPGATSNAATTADSACSVRGAKKLAEPVPVLVGITDGVALDEREAAAAPALKSDGGHRPSVAGQTPAKREELESATISKPTSFHFFETTNAQVVDASVPLPTVQTHKGPGTTDGLLSEQAAAGLVQPLANVALIYSGAKPETSGAQHSKDNPHLSLRVNGDPTCTTAASTMAEGSAPLEGKVDSPSAVATSSPGIDPVRVAEGFASVNPGPTDPKGYDAPAARLSAIDNAVPFTNSVPVPNPTANPTISVEPKVVVTEKKSALGRGLSTDPIQERTLGRTVHFEVASVHNDALRITQPGAVKQDGVSPTLVRDPAGMGTGEGRQAVLRGDLSDSASAFAGRDPFQAPDSEITSPTATWAHAGTRYAEAGYLDPALGWVSVRAEAAGGGVHAAVVPGSAEAAQALSGHLTGLNTYLAEHHGQTAAVTLAAPESGHWRSESGQSMNLGGGQQQESSGQRDPDVGKPNGKYSATVERGAQSFARPAAVDGQMNEVFVASTPRGIHISVVA